MEEIGKLFGILIIFLYGLTISKYIFKLADRKYNSLLAKNKKFYLIFSKIKKSVMKYHRIFGVCTILILLTHVIIQISNIGISLTGLLAGLVLVTQVVLGIYMAINKSKLKQLLIFHKMLSVLIFLAIIIHII